MAGPVSGVELESAEQEISHAQKKKAFDLLKRIYFADI